MHILCFIAKGPIDFATFSKEPQVSLMETLRKVINFLKSLHFMKTTDGKCIAVHVGTKALPHRQYV